MKRKWALHFTLAMVAGCAAAQRDASAQIYKSLYNFSGGSDGAEPFGSLIQSGSLLYGMTKQGGIGVDFFGKGTIFSFDPATNTQTVLHAFTGSPNDGAAPYGSLAVSGSILYGMTNIGGANGYGTVFSYSITNGSYNLAHSFNLPEGAGPQGSILPSATILYSFTGAGGPTGNGTLFAIPTDTQALSVLHPFSGSLTDGKWPQGTPVQSGNLLFGMSQLGGSSDKGALFSYDVSSGQEMLLHSFIGGITDGASPHGSPLLANGKLYGMTSTGGANNLGTIFSYDPFTGQEAILHSFAGGPQDGALPNGSLIISGNTLYGMTGSGGADSATQAPHGTVFAFDLATSTLSLLHAFQPGTPAIPEQPITFPPGIDGANPTGDLLLVGNTLYGMTPATSGDNGYGTIFSITLPEPASSAILGIGTLGFLAKRRKNCAVRPTSND